jgi:hypothetical protein
MTPNQKLMRLTFGFAVSQALRVVAELQIADRLADGPRPVEELAREVGAHPEALYRVMRVLVAEGVFSEDGERSFALTDVGAALRSGEGPRDFVIMINSEPYHAFEELMHAVRTGDPAFDQVFGQARFDWLAANPKSAAVFQRAMVALGQGANEAVADAYDFGPFRTVVDVGGGHGQLLSEILARNPHLSGILFDLPLGIAAARAGLGGDLPRTKLIPGNFFEAVPSGADVYILKKVIHDWDDKRAIDILRNCRKAMLPEGRVLLAETIIPPGNEPDLIKFSDLNMLAVTGGQERTDHGYAYLFSQAGLELTGVMPTKSAIQILEARVAS